jgi:hypothetical protein
MDGSTHPAAVHGCADSSGIITATCDPSRTTLTHPTTSAPKRKPVNAAGRSIVIGVGTFLAARGRAFGPSPRAGRSTPKNFREQTPRAGQEARQKFSRI